MVKPPAMCSIGGAPLWDVKSLDACVIELLFGVGRHFTERFVDLHDLDFISQLGPAAEHVGIFLRGAAGVRRLPVAQEDVVVIAVAVEKVAPIALSGDDCGEFLESFEGGGLVLGERFPDGY